MKPIIRHAKYDFQGREEYCLIAGGDVHDDGNPRRILFVPPLFDEMNRVRRTWVQAMRELASNNVASALPDLPGCNESVASLEQQSIDIWREAVACAAESFQATHIFSVRGGCLIDDAAGLPVMRLSPAKGASILKNMIRTKIAGDKEAGVISNAESLSAALADGPVELAGHAIGAEMWHSLESAIVEELHDSYDIHPVTGKSWALWLRAEPQYDPEIAQALAATLDSVSAKAI